MSPKQSVLESFKEGADFWRAALEAYPEAITVHSSDGIVLYASERLAKIYNRRTEEIEGKGCSELFHGAGVICPHEDALVSGSVYQADKPFLIEGRYFRLAIEPIRTESGQVVGFMRILRDVTDAHKAREQLLKAEQFATLGQMINGLAHDVGTPLNIISGYSEYVLMRSAPGAQGYTEVSTILQQTRRIAEYIKQMLDLARPSPGRTEAITLNNFFSELLDLINHQLRKSDVKASVKGLAGPPVIYGDAPLLRQAFFNLMLNACQSVGAGGSIDIVVEEAKEDLNYVNVALFGADALGHGHDFSISLKGFLSTGGESVIEGLGLTLARELFDRLAAGINSTDAGTQGKGLIIKLPIKGGSEAATHNNG